MEKDITIFAEALQQKIQQANQAPLEDPLAQASKALNTARNTLLELKLFVSTYTFRDSAEEVRFFKEIKPIFLSHYLYQRKLFSIILFDSFSEMDARIENYNSILTKLQRYAMKHQDFFQYCHSGASHRDTWYFVRSGLFRPSGHAHVFTTGYDKKLSRMLAHEMIKQYVLTAIRSAKPSEVQPFRFQWSASKTDLVELIYALHAAQVVNNGRVEVKQLHQAFELFFNIPLEHFYDLLRKIRQRKTNQASFLDSLRENLEKKLEDMDA